MKRLVLCLLVLFSTAWAAERRAKNVILFIGDAGGIPTLHAASLHAHDAPQKLFIQSMPNLALMDTSAADGWVTDSAAGMTAIVTGRKTNNGVLSQDESAVRGRKDGEVLKTVLEYAEERGLSTGVLSNMHVTDATPAACYAHSNDRGKRGEIFAQVLSPRFGDGIDLIIGPGRAPILKATAEMGLDLEPELKKKGYWVSNSLEGMPPDARRVVVLMDSGEYDAAAAVERAIGILSRNRKGFFLMVEWDMHTTDTRRGLDRVITMDKVIRQTALQRQKDSLILFAADHSFDLRVRGGRKGEPLLPPPGGDSAPPARPRVRVDNGHTGEEVLAAGLGPGSERLRGYIPNTQLFHIMLAAWGWPAK